MRHIRPRVLTSEQATDLAAGLDDGEIDERTQVICLAPVADETTTLSAAAHELHAFAVWLVELEHDGWQMVENAGGDAHLRVINADARKRVYTEDS